MRPLAGATRNFYFFKNSKFVRATIVDANSLSCLKFFELV